MQIVQLVIFYLYLIFYICAQTFDDEVKSFWVETKQGLTGITYYYYKGSLAWKVRVAYFSQTNCQVPYIRVPKGMG